uniref:LO2-3 n=1 Tax=Swordtail adomavirus 1 TaxID=2609876 RepID=A0A6F9F0I7_9VIRU|nr:TPA_asm: LO2-3 [Swordtail adomavirus 1]
MYMCIVVLYSAIYRMVRKLRTKTLRAAKIRKKKHTKQNGTAKTNVKDKPSTAMSTRRTTHLQRARTYTVTPRSKLTALAKPEINVNVSVPVTQSQKQKIVPDMQVVNSKTNTADVKPTDSSSFLGRALATVGKVALPLATGSALSMFGVPQPIGSMVGSAISGFATGTEPAVPYTDIAPDTSSTWLTWAKSLVPAAGIALLAGKRGSGYNIYEGMPDNKHHVYKRVKKIRFTHRSQKAIRRKLTPVRTPTQYKLLLNKGVHTVTQVSPITTAINKALLKATQLSPVVRGTPDITVHNQLPEHPKPQVAENTITDNTDNSDTNDYFEQASNQYDPTIADMFHPEQPLDTDHNMLDTPIPLQQDEDVFPPPPSPVINSELDEEVSQYMDTHALQDRVSPLFYSPTNTPSPIASPIPSTFNMFPPIAPPPPPPAPPPPAPAPSQGIFASYNPLSLLSSILPSKNHPEEPAPAPPQQQDSRSLLLNQIKAGVPLRKVSNMKHNTPRAPNGDIMKSLMNNLEIRRGSIAGSPTPDINDLEDW